VYRTDEVVQGVAGARGSYRLSGVDRDGGPPPTAYLDLVRGGESASKVIVRSGMSGPVMVAVPALGRRNLTGFPQ